MNFDESMKAKINDSVINALERMKTLSLNQDQNYYLSLENGLFLILIWMMN